MDRDDGHNDEERVRGGLWSYADNEGVKGHVTGQCDCAREVQIWTVLEVIAHGRKGRDWRRWSRGTTGRSEDRRRRAQDEETSGGSADQD